MIKSDVLTLIGMSLFALSNGIIGTIAMMKYTNCVSENSKTKAAAVQSFVLNSGLFVAGFVSLGFGALFR